MRRPRVVIALFVLAVWAHGGTPLRGAETLSNADVVALIEAGMDLELVKRKLQASDNDFDVSAKAMVELRQAGVPDEIIGLMLTQAERLRAQRDRRLSMHIQSLTSDRLETRQNAYMALLRLGHSARDALLEVLTTSSNAALRAAVAEAVARMGIREAVPVLAVLLDHPDSAARQAAADALVVLDEAQARKLIGLTLEDWGREHTATPRPVDGYIRLAGQAGMKGAAEQIQRILQESELAADRAAAARALGRLRLRESLATLTRAVDQDSAATVRAAAIDALARFGERESVRVVERAAQRDEANRAVALRALAAFPPKLAVPKLIQLLDHDLKDAELAALMASLRRLTHQDFGPNRAQWLAWWEANEDALDGGE